MRVSPRLWGELRASLLAVDASDADGIAFSIFERLLAPGS
jgi:hypothetical protein